jgi:hypothetical protein
VFYAPSIARLREEIGPPFARSLGAVKPTEVGGNVACQVAAEGPILRVDVETTSLGTKVGPISLEDGHGYASR